MNTKNKIIAILMASIVAMAVGVPMAMGDNAETSASVGNVDPTIACTDCPPAVDLNPKPVAGAVPTTVWINGTLGDDNEYEDIDTVTCDAGAFGANLTGACSCVKNKVDDISGTFNCSFDLDGCTPEGNYDVTVTVTDLATATDTCGCTVHINGGIGLELDFDVINYGDVQQGVHKNILGDKVWDVLNTGPRTVHSMGNSPIDININATDMTRTGGVVGVPLDTIHAEDLDAKVCGDGPKWLVENTCVMFWTCIECCELNNMDFSIQVNNPVRKGAYTGTMEIDAVLGCGP